MSNPEKAAKPSFRSFDELNKMLLGDMPEFEDDQPLELHYRDLRTPII